MHLQIKINTNERINSFEKRKSVGEGGGVKVRGKNNFSSSFDESDFIEQDR